MCVYVCVLMPKMNVSNKMCLYGRIEEELCAYNADGKGVVLRLLISGYLVFIVCLLVSCFVPACEHSVCVFLSELDVGASLLVFCWT